MIRENQKFLNQLNAFTDAILLVLSMICAHALRFLVFTGEAGHIEMPYYIQSIFVVTPLFLLIYSGLNLYDSFRTKPLYQELGLIVVSNGAGTLVLVVAYFLLKNVNISRWVLFFFFLVSSILISLKRLLLRHILKRAREKGYNQKRVLLVGSGRLAREYVATIEKNKIFGYHIEGYLAKGGEIHSVPRLGGLDDLEEAIAKRKPDEVVAALEIGDYDYMGGIIKACETDGTKLSVIPFYSKYMPAHPYIDDLDGLPMINIRRIPLDNLFNAFVKRTVDIVGSVVLLAVTSPVMLAAAIGIKLSSPGPVIFKQQRVGKGKKPFTMYKFRSMRLNGDSATAWSRNEDPRKTRFGSLLRKFSIDEFPQFYNVLKGDMSLVGPRPELPYFVHKFRDEIPLYMVKHQVRPGITGWAQVCGYRGDTSIKGRIEHDIYYIENWSFFFDVKILLQTVFKGFKNNEEIVR